MHKRNEVKLMQNIVTFSRKWRNEESEQIFERMENYFHDECEIPKTKICFSKRRFVTPFEHVKLISIFSLIILFLNIQTLSWKPNQISINL